MAHCKGCPPNGDVFGSMGAQCLIEHERARFGIESVSHETRSREEDTCRQMYIAMGIASKYDLMPPWCTIVAAFGAER